MKVVIAALLLAVLVATTSCNAENPFNRWGRLLLNDTLVYAQHVEANGIWLIEREVDVVYPTKNYVNDRWITSIQAMDGNTKGNGGNVTIIAGGVNSKSVHLRFRSQRGHSIDFNLKIFTGPCYSPW